MSTQDIKTKIKPIKITLYTPSKKKITGDELYKMYEMKIIIKMNEYGFQLSTASTARSLQRTPAPTKQTSTETLYACQSVFILFFFIPICLHIKVERFLRQRKKQHIFRWNTSVSNDFETICYMRRCYACSAYDLVQGSLRRRLYGEEFCEFSVFDVCSLRKSLSFELNDAQAA